MRGVGFWAEGGSGPSGRQGELGRGAGLTGKKQGGEGWAACGFGLVSGFLFSSPFSFSKPLKLIELKLNLNSDPKHSTK